MATSNCYGISLNGGLVLSGKVDAAVCTQDGFPYVFPSLSLGLGGSMIGAYASAYRESTEYDDSGSYAAETVNSWWKGTYIDHDIDGIPLIRNLKTIGRSDTDYKEPNIDRNDYSLGLAFMFPVFGEAPDMDKAYSGSIKFDILALAWNGIADAGESIYHFIRDLF